jgi:hypothetical protein
MLRSCPSYPAVVRSYVRRREYRPSDVRPFDSPIEQIVRILVPVEDGDIVTAPQHTKIADLMIITNKVKRPAC